MPGYVWHLTHRCHRKQFLLKFLKDRRLWVRWLYEARRRFGLCVLDYHVTSNHVHLVVRDRGGGEIARSMQLIAGRTGQQFNCRKDRRGAFWEDRYHATAIENGEHLARCLVYIDLNMVRTGVVQHPSQWLTCGYHEIQNPPQRFRIIDRPALADALGVQPRELSATHAEHIASALAAGTEARIPEWSTSVAVGGRDFVERVATELGGRARGRVFEPFEAGFILREPSADYRGVSASGNDGASSKTRRC